MVGIRLEQLAKKQLQAWYKAELQSSPAASSTPGASDLKDLPALATLTQPGSFKVTILWDLDSIKPFTQIHRQEASAAPQNTASAPGSTTEPSTQGPRSQSGSGGSSYSRLAAAGLAGGPGSSASAPAPDLIGALDQLCRTIQEYGTVHAVHLFLRESALSRSTALRRQVEQLTSWVDSPEWLDEPQGQGEVRSSGDGGSAAAAPTLNASQQPGGDASSLAPAQQRLALGRRHRGSSRATAAAKAARAAAHDCPLCRATEPTRLALLQHFSSAHQGPLLEATATNLRNQIMWTRGRPITVATNGAEDPGAGATAPDATGDSDAVAGQGGVQLSPQEFVYARELLMKGRHLDPLLAAAPPTILQQSSPGQEPDSSSNPATDPPAAAAGARSGVAAKRAAPARGPGGEPGDASGPGLYLHLLATGVGAEAVAAELRKTAGEITEAATAAGARETWPAANGRGRGRAAVSGRRAVAREASATCLCVVSDAEGVDQIMTDLQRREIPSIAVTRAAKVPSAAASLRWWAVQSGEYRLRDRAW